MDQSLLAIERLCLTVTTASDRPIAGNPYETSILAKRVPNEMLPDNRREPLTIAIDGDEAQAFSDASVTLAADKRFEYLSNAELEDRIWRVVCKAILQPELFGSEPAIHVQTEAFFAESARPVQDYEFTWAVNNLTFDGRLTMFWGSVLRRMNEEELKEISDADLVFFTGLTREEFAKKSVIQVRETGTNHSHAAKRAQAKANHCLDVLRVAISAHPWLTEEQCLISLSECYLARVVNSGSVVRVGWSADRSPSHFDFQNALSNQLAPIQHLFMQLECLPKPFRDNVSRHLSWISRAIVEENLDIKAVFLCSALEALLTSKDDQSKSIRIIVRFLTLHKEFARPFPDPIDMIIAYRYRSDIIHGSKMNVVTQKLYGILLWEARQVSDLYAEYAGKTEAQSPFELLRTLDKSPHRKTAIQWLVARYPKLIHDFPSYFKGESPTRNI
jgi:hypothetical protein